MTYVDINGVHRNLTTLQAKYLTHLGRQGHLELSSADGKSFRDTATFHRLQDRGLAIGVEWHCPLSSECLVEMTDLGRTALRLKGKK